MIRLPAAVLAGSLLIVACATPPATPTSTPEPTPTTVPATPTQAPATPTQAPTSAPPTAPATPAPSPTSAVIGTEGRIVNNADGYAMTLPSGWRRIELEAGDLDDILAGIDDPELRERLGDSLDQALERGIRVMAFRTADLGNSFATNVNVISAPVGSLSLDAIEQLNVAQIEGLGIVEGEVAADRVTLAAGEAVRLRYRLSEALIGTAYSTDQYLILADGTLHVMTVSGLEAADIAADAEAMAESFEILD